MRPAPILAAALAFAVAAALAVLAASAAARVVEQRSVRAVEGALLDDGHTWARVVGDGLQIVLEGRAPTEAARFRAISAAGAVVDASRVIDSMTVAETTRVAPPQFAIEILRNDSGISLIGLIPAASDRAGIQTRLSEIAGSLPVTDLLESADYPAPPGWDPALRFALDALGRLPRSKISVAAGRVTITAISDSNEARRRLEADLARAAPAAITLSLDISAPRPVVTPFTLRFTIDEAGARFDACAADSEAAQRAILAAGIAAGAPAGSSCPLALGVPSATWGRAVAQSIAALAELGQGTLTFSDANITLVAAASTPPDLFERVVGELSNALPDVYALDASRLDAARQPAGPVEFVVTRSPEGAAVLRGRIPDDLMNETAENLAKARFGANAVRMATLVGDAGLPPGWSVRVLAGIEALARISSGTVIVRPDRVQVRGLTGNADSAAEISRLLIDRLGEAAAFDVDVTYDEALDPVAALPTPEECLRRIEEVTASSKITFDPGSATLNRAGAAVVDAIAGILRNCAELRLRIAGYTDSQGRDETNLALSQARAEAVLQALRARRVPVGSFEAVGFGEADPIADNATEAGREANRRIEFSLIGAPAAADAAEAAAEDGDGDGAEAAASVWPDAPGPLAPGTGTGGPAQPQIRLVPRPQDLVPAEAAGD
jgi:OOP family OmpA-OmpF porin